MSNLVILRFNEIMYCDCKHPCPIGAKRREAEVYQLAREVIEHFKEIVRERPDDPPENHYFALLDRLSEVRDFALSDLGVTIQRFGNELHLAQAKGSDESEIIKLRDGYCRRINNNFSHIIKWLDYYENTTAPCEEE